MNRRELFGAMAAGAAAAMLPAWVSTAVPYPHVYLARSEDVGNELERETWKHSTDGGWARMMVVHQDMPYKERYDIMNELYLWGRDREAA